MDSILIEIVSLMLFNVYYSSRLAGGLARATCIASRMSLSEALSHSLEPPLGITSDAMRPRPRLVDRNLNPGARIASFLSKRLHSFGLEFLFATKFHDE